MADFDGPTNEERMQIAQHFMLNSPPGQFKDVTNDVKKLLPDGVMTDAQEMGIARAYNNKNNKIVKAPSGAFVTLNVTGEIDATHYVDPSNGSTFSVDHITLETSEADADSTLDANIELQRAALQSAVDSYVKETYPDSDACASVYSKDGKLKVVITGEKSNLRNFWGGKWSSTWDIEWSGGQTTCTGEFKVHAHYFEDGNVQLQTTKAIPPTKWSWDFSEAQTSTVVQHIKEKEDELSAALLMMLYVNFHTETLKRIRRILPVTKLKMDWNSVRNSLTSQLQAGLK